MSRSDIDISKITNPMRALGNIQPIPNPRHPFPKAIHMGYGVSIF